MNESSSSRTLRGALVASALGLCGLTAVVMISDTGSPAPPAPAATSGARGTGGTELRRERVPPRRPELPGAEPADEGTGVSALDLASERGPANLDGLADAAAHPRRDADVRPPPPPEAFLPVPPRVREPDPDSGLVFRNDDPGDATEKTKPPAAFGAQPPSGEATPPRSRADVLPPVDPAALVPMPPRTPVDQDSGLVFTDRPSRSADANADKR